MSEPLTFQHAVQSWLDFKWPKCYIAIQGSQTNHLDKDREWLQIDGKAGHHILCIATDGATCKIDFIKDRGIEIVPLADPKFFRQLQVLVRRRR